MKSIFPSRQQSDMTKKSKLGVGTPSGIRPRIPVWYFLLTALTALVSILVTREL